MKKIIENVIPNVIDCQGILGAIFTSLLTGIKKDIPEGMAICNNSYRKTGNIGELCTRCGNCPGKTIKDQIYFNIANEYAFVCGDVLLQFDMTNGNIHWSDKLKMLEPEGDPIDFMFKYAGYTYNSFNTDTDKVTIFNKIVSSIDKGIPVILQYKPIYMYLLVTGYDNEKMALYGYDGSHKCSFMKPAPDNREGNLFCATNWYESMGRVIILGEKCEPLVTLDDVISRNISIMKSIFDGKYYDKASDYIMNDENFKDENDNLSVQAQLISNFIDFPIGGRSAVSWYLFLQLGEGADYIYYSPDSGCDEKYKEAFRRMADCCCDIHEICWVAWRGVGTCEENKQEIIARLSDPIYRKVLAGVIRLVGMKDRHLYEALCVLNKIN